MAPINDQIPQSPTPAEEPLAVRIARARALRVSSAIPNANHHVQSNPYSPSNPTTPVASVIQTTPAPNIPTTNYIPTPDSTPDPELGVTIPPDIKRVPMRSPIAAPASSIPAAHIAIAAPVLTSNTPPVRTPPTVAQLAAPALKAEKVKPMSDTTVLPPDFKGVFVSDDDRHGRRGYDNYNVYDGTERVKDSMTAGFAGVNAGVGIVGVAVEKNGSAAQLATEKIGAALGVAVEKTSASGQLTTEKTAAATLIANERTAAQNAAAAALGFATNASAQQAGYAAIQLGQVKYAGEVAVQNTMNAAAAALAASTNTASILRGQEVFAGQAALTAATNQAAVLAAIAQCCCESQKLVLAQSNEVKALINATESARTGRELAQAQAEILALKYRFPHPPFPPVA